MNHGGSIHVPGFGKVDADSLRKVRFVLCTLHETANTAGQLAASPTVKWM
jgi:hypothetical protein